MKCILAGGLPRKQGFVFYDFCGTPFITDEKDVLNSGLIWHTIQHYKLGSWQPNFRYKTQRYMVIKGVSDIIYSGTSLELEYSSKHKICFSPTFSYTVMDIDTPFEDILPCSVFDKSNLKDIFVDLPDDIPTQAKDLALYALSSKILIKKSSELFHQERTIIPHDLERIAIPWGVSAIESPIPQLTKVKKLIIPSTVERIFGADMPNLESIEITGCTNRHPLELTGSFPHLKSINSVNRLVCNSGCLADESQINLLGGTVLV